MKIVLLFIMLLYGGNLYASAVPNVNGPFSITINDYGLLGGFAVPQELKTEIDTMLRQVQNEVNSKLPEADQSTYLKGMSNAGVMSTKGLGVDYASAPDIFVVGAGIGVGADVGNNTFSDLVSGNVEAEQIRGVGLQGSVMAGVNLGVFNLPKIWVIDLSRITTFLNFFTYDLPSGKDYGGSLTNFGFHLQYQLTDGLKLPFHLFRWGGVFITTGLDYSSMKLSFTKTFNQTKQTTYNGTFPYNNLNLNANFNGTATAGAEVNIKTIPIELSSHVQLLHVLTIFGGLAADINFGEAKSLAAVNGTVTVSDTPNGYLNGFNASAGLNLGDKGSPTTINGRWFIGTQLNITLLKLFAQLNSGIGQDTWGVAAGIRLAY